MITEYLFLWSQLDDVDLEDKWFQQYGDTSHSANVTINLFEIKFGERVISRNGPVGWPHRSCNLTPLDYFLWGYVKSMVHASDDWWTSYEYRTWNCSSIGRFMLENRQKLGSASGLLQACAWWPCKRNRISFIMTSNVLLQE